MGSDAISVNTPDIPQLARKRPGSPFAMIAILLIVWVTGRGLLWENPFAEELFATSFDPLIADASFPTIATGKGQPSAQILNPVPRHNPSDSVSWNETGPAPRLFAEESQMAFGHQFLWQSAVSSAPRQTLWRARRAMYETPRANQASVPVFPGTPSFAIPEREPGQVLKSDRWSLSAWAFVREGPARVLIAPGPAPVYGASQAGASLQYRFALGDARDPRAYTRVTRALISEPESELALGLSARPVTALPIRIAAEIRATDSSFARDLRPAAFAITELPPVSLPMDIAAEVYAAGGYVGGSADTGFADGQATLTRSISAFDLSALKDINVSLGAGAWGGIQRGVHRVDVGPTLRLDMALGDVPARISIDYRERIDGDATPGSGVAATLSTQF